MVLRIGTKNLASLYVGVINKMGVREGQPSTYFLGICHQLNLYLIFEYSNFYYL